MKSLKKSTYVLSFIAVIAVLLFSCETEDPNMEEPTEINGLIELSKYEINFGEIKSSSTKNAKELKEEILTLYNNSDSLLTGLGSSITFPGRAGVVLTFSPVEPGDSISVPFTYSADGLAPGEYTGEARLIPSIGDTLKVQLKATVVE